MVTYLTSQNQDRITSVKVVFEDFSVQEYHVTFKELKRDISIYTLEGLDLVLVIFLVLYISSYI